MLKMSFLCMLKPPSLTLSDQMRRLLTILIFRIRVENDSNVNALMVNANGASTLKKQFVKVN